MALLTMIIDLSSVGTEPKSIRKTFRTDEIDLGESDVTLVRPVELKAEFSRVETKTTLEGTIDTSISRDCTRCLEPVHRDVSIEFQTSFVDAEDEESAELEVSLEELDVSLADEGTVNITDVIREQILLAMPIQNFCGENCKGLCSKCGANLNLKSCDCSDDEIDPRWEALKDLK